MAPSRNSLLSIAAALGVFALLAAAAPTHPAWANGAGFFDETQGEDAGGTVYFGFTKTPQGKAIKDVDVKITVNGPGTPQSYIIHSNVIGIYRLTRVPLDTDPKLVEITAWKKGYKLVQKVKRSRSTKAGDPVQHDFIFQAVD